MIITMPEGGLREGQRVLVLFGDRWDLGRVTGRVFAVFDDDVRHLLFRYDAMNPAVEHVIIKLRRPSKLVVTGVIPVDHEAYRYLERL